MLTHFIVTWLVTSASLYLISKLPLGIEIGDVGTALVGGLILGILNATIRPILQFVAFPVTFLTLGLFAIVVNALVFSIAAALVPNFRIRGCLGAITGPILLGLINGAILSLF